MVSLQARTHAGTTCTLIGPLRRVHSWDPLRGENVPKMDVVRFPLGLVWHMHLVAGLMYVASHKCQTEGERMDCPGGGSETSADFPVCERLDNLGNWQYGFSDRDPQFREISDQSNKSCRSVSSLQYEWVIFSVCLESNGTSGPCQTLLGGFLWAVWLQPLHHLDFQAKQPLQSKN